MADNGHGWLARRLTREGIDFATADNAFVRIADFTRAQALADALNSALDTKAAQPLIKDFSALYPGVKVEYNDMNSTEIYNRFIAEAAAGQGVGRRGVELGDGPAGEARGRRPRA